MDNQLNDNNQVPLAQPTPQMGEIPQAQQMPRTGEVPQIQQFPQVEQMPQVQGIPNVEEMPPKPPIPQTLPLYSAMPNRLNPPKQIDIKRIFATRQVNIVSGLTLLQYVLSTLLVFGISMLGVNFYSTDGNLWIQAGAMFLATALPFFIYLVMKRGRMAQFLRFEKVGVLNSVLLIFAGYFICFLGNYLGAMVSSVFESLGDQNLGLPTNSSNSTAFLSIFVVAVLAPIIEEFVFRGVILSSLRRFGTGFAVVTSAIIFGLVHMDLATVAFALPAGLVFGYIYVKTNNLWIAIAIHSVNNLIAIVSTHLHIWVREDMVGLVSNIITFVPISMGIIAFVFVLIFKRSLLFTPSKPIADFREDDYISAVDPLPLTSGKAVSAVAHSPAFWGIVLLMAASTVMLIVAPMGWY